MRGKHYEKLIEILKLCRNQKKDKIWKLDIDILLCKLERELIAIKTNFKQRVKWGLMNNAR